MDPSVQIGEVALEACLVILPRQAVDSGSRITLEREEGLAEQIGADVMGERGELLLLA